MNINELAANNTTIYGEKYEVVARQKIADTPAAQGWFSQCEKATVEETNFDWGVGRSICFHCKGGKHYEILSSLSSLKTGQEVDLQSVEYQHLHRTGEDKLRVDGVAKN